jgi:hypothetical protein
MTSLPNTKLKPLSSTSNLKQKILISFKKKRSLSQNIKEYKTYSDFQSFKKARDKSIIYKNKKSNYYNKYYMSSDLFHKDYISDLTFDKNNKSIHNKKVNKMKETDNKIERLAKILKIYQNQRGDNKNKIKIINMNDKININNNLSQENYKQNDKDNHKSEKILIKGTKIISPFCDFSRNHYLYKKIFYYSDKNKNLKSDLLDNKLNIIYSENENQYKQNILKLNELYKRMGKNKYYNLEPSQSENKIKTLKYKVKFMKRIVDYTFPNMVLTKIREQKKNIIYEKKSNKINIVTSKINRNNFNRFNRQLSEGLIRNLNIHKYLG